MTYSELLEAIDNAQANVIAYTARFVNGGNAQPMIWWRDEYARLLHIQHSMVLNS
jgi:hypothetical protein